MTATTPQGTIQNIIARTNRILAIPREKLSRATILAAAWPGDPTADYERASKAGGQTMAIRGIAEKLGMELPEDFDRAQNILYAAAKDQTAIEMASMTKAERAASYRAILDDPSTSSADRVLYGHLMADLRPLTIRPDAPTGRCPYCDSYCDGDCRSR